MKQVSIKDPDSVKYDIDKINLSVLITQNGLSFSLKSIEDNKFLTLSSMLYSNKRRSHNEIEKYFKTEKITGPGYNSSTVVIADSRQTLVPSALFSVGTEKSIWELNFEPDDSCEIVFSHLEKSENYIVFPVNKSLLLKLKELLSEFDIFPSSFTFIENHFTDCKLQEDSTERLFIQVFEDYFELLVLGKSGIKLFNTFTYNTNNDIIYYIISVFDRLKLAPADTKIVFSGFVNADDNWFVTLKKFIAQVGVESQSINHNCFYRFNEIAPHYFYNFLNF